MRTLLITAALLAGCARTLCEPIEVDCSDVDPHLARDLVAFSEDISSMPHLDRSTTREEAVSLDSTRAMQCGLREAIAWVDQRQGWATPLRPTLERMASCYDSCSDQCSEQDLSAVLDLVSRVYGNGTLLR